MCLRPAIRSDLETLETLAVELIMGLGRKKIILISAVSVVVIAAIVIPIAIVYSRTDEPTPTPDEGTSTPAPVEDLGNRIACFPLGN